MVLITAEGAQRGDASGCSCGRSLDWEEVIFVFLEVSFRKSSSCIHIWILFVHDARLTGLSSVSYRSASVWAGRGRGWTTHPQSWPAATHSRRDEAIRFSWIHTKSGKEARFHRVVGMCVSLGLTLDARQPVKNPRYRTVFTAGFPSPFLCFFPELRQLQYLNSLIWWEYAKGTQERALRVSIHPPTNIHYLNWLTDSGWQWWCWSIH